MKELFTLYYHRRILFTDFFSQSLYIHRKIISVLYKTPIDVIEIKGSSIFFATHLYIYKLALEPFDIPAQCFQLGDLTPATTFLIKLIQNFSRNKPTD